MNNKVNFFLLCPPKSGSTSVYTYLDSHPDIFMCPIKEPNYFSDDIDTSEFSDKFGEWSLYDMKTYLSHDPLSRKQIWFVRDSHQYAALYRWASESQLRWEASTSYLWSQSAAKNIAKHNIDAKFVVVLRNPIERAYSHYIMNIKYWYTGQTFREDMQDDLIIDEGKRWKNFLYYELGLYSEQLQRYFDIFPREHFFITTTSQLWADPQAVMSDIYSFLSISDQIQNDTTRKNVWWVHRFAWSQAILQNKRIQIIARYIPVSLKMKMTAMIYQSAERMSLEDKKWMYTLYEDELQKIYNLFWWKFFDSPQLD